MMPKGHAKGTWEVRGVRGWWVMGVGGVRRGIDLFVMLEEESFTPELRVMHD
jgi:hypothetical protein